MECSTLPNSGLETQSLEKVFPMTNGSGLLYSRPLVVLRVFCDSMNTVIDLLLTFTFSSQHMKGEQC